MQQKSSFLIYFGKFLCWISKVAEATKLECILYFRFKRAENWKPAIFLEVSILWKFNK